LAGQVELLPFAPAGGWLGVMRQSGAMNVDWLIGLAEQLLLDAGLIGLPHGELRAMLERRAAEAAPKTVSYRPFAGEGDAGAALHGLSTATSFYDLLRGIYEGLGLAARDGYAALGFQPNEVRVNATTPAGPLAHECLAACLGMPVFMIGCEAPAAAGAALVAAVSLGQYPDVVEASRDWAEPRLSGVQPVDRKLEARSAPSNAAPAPT
jgi:erythritol kinase